ncbi:hypothetical protein [Arthrospiribacter ruber]|uniref:Uncharacterized protein n=1 Tax=Arthrospiribacter ruber TaxID=2487934 RepID=A0A951J2V4_9BACT|nr:hypothetical protein [Arthrospiribacter ruber]MBW3470449.1 hypothetical protein [Arthrospiribacter ruber]
MKIATEKLQNYFGASSLSEVSDFGKLCHLIRPHSLRIWFPAQWDRLCSSVQTPQSGLLHPVRTGLATCLASGRYPRA